MVPDYPLTISRQREMVLDYPLTISKQSLGKVKQGETRIHETNLAITALGYLLLGINLNANLFFILS